MMALNSSSDDGGHRSVFIKFVVTVFAVLRGISAALLAPRQFVVAARKYLSKSTVFAVFDTLTKKWLFRVDRAHLKGAKYPHINVNPALTGVRDPHVPIPGALVSLAGRISWVVLNAGDVVMALVVSVDLYRIVASAISELQETGGVSRDTAKVAAGAGGAWVGGIVGAAVGGKVGAMSGWLLVGPVGAGVGSILGAVVGGVWGGSKGCSKCDYLVDQRVKIE